MSIISSNMDDCDKSSMYIFLSKTEINKYLERNQYDQAFKLLVIVLRHLSIKEKEDIITYYNNYLFLKFEKASIDDTA